LKTRQSGVILALMGSNNLFGSFLKEIRDQNKVIRETVSQVQNDARKLATQSGLQEVAEDVTAIKAAVVATNQDLAAPKGSAGTTERVTK
jgi:hypothetical protein